MIVDYEILEKLIEVVNFYGNPATYVAIRFFPDPPCGDLMEDFSDAGIYGKKTRKNGKICF